MVKPSKRSTTRRRPDARGRLARGLVQGSSLQAGSGETGSGETGSGETGSGETGSGQTGSPSTRPPSTRPPGAGASAPAVPPCDRSGASDPGLGASRAGGGAAPGTPEDGRSRRCVASGAVKPESALIRFARAPDGALTPDLGARLPGRGVWVSADRRSLAAALKRDAFSRGFDAPTTAPAHLADLIEALLAERCRGVLGMARRAGALQIGAENVAAALRTGGVSWLIEARDGARDGRDRLLALAKASGAAISVTGLLSGDELGMALGRDRVVHASLSKGRFADRWASEAHRLAGFRTMAPEDWSF